MMHDASYCFATPMSLYYKFVAVRQEGRIPQLLAQHSFLSKALVGEHRALFFLQDMAMILPPCSIAFTSTRIFFIHNKYFRTCALT